MPADSSVAEGARAVSLSIAPVEKRLAPNCYVPATRYQYLKVSRIAGVKLSFVTVRITRYDVLVFLVGNRSCLRPVVGLVRGGSMPLLLLLLLHLCQLLYNCSTVACTAVVLIVRVHLTIDSPPARLQEETLATTRFRAALHTAVIYV